MERISLTVLEEQGGLIELITDDVWPTGGVRITRYGHDGEFRITIILFTLILDYNYIFLL